MRDDADSLLDLHLDRPRPPIRTYAADEVDFTVPPTLSQGILAFQHRLHLTSFQVVLAVFALLLHKLSGQADILLGTVSGL